MGALSRLIDAGGEHRASLEHVEDDLFIDPGRRAAVLTRFFTLLVLASVIAAGGVVGDSTPAVIGAMIIAPLATPIYGAALAVIVASRRHLRDALFLLVAGMVVNVLIGALIAVVTFDRVPVALNPQIVGRTAPTILDLVIAIAAGAAGSFALVRRDVVTILAGVAIAISLVPVLEVVGVTLGSGRPDLAWGALILFLTNAAAIIVAGVAMFSAAGYGREAAERREHAGWGARLLIAVLVIVLVIPLTVTSVRTYRYQRWMSATDAAARRWAANSGWRVTGVHQEGDEIVATVIGAGDPPALDTLREDVRRSVPATVAIRLIEDSGTTVDI